MNWYLAKLRFQLMGESCETALQWDEQLCLIPAASPEEALHKAHSLGLQKQEYFLDKQLQWVKRQFIHVTELEFMGHLLNTIRWNGLPRKVPYTASCTTPNLTIAMAPKTRIWLHKIVHTLVRTGVICYQYTKRFRIAFG